MQIKNNTSYFLGDYNSIRWLNIISKQIFFILNKKFEKFGFKRGQFHILLHIYKYPGICQDDLASKIKINKDEAAKGIKKLIELGFVSRKKDKSDRRKYNVFPTEKALYIKDEFENILEETNNILFKDFNNDEKDVIMNFLTKIADNVCEKSYSIRENR